MLTETSKPSGAHLIDVVRVVVATASPHRCQPRERCSNYRVWGLGFAPGRYRRGLKMEGISAESLQERMPDFPMLSVQNLRRLRKSLP